MGVTGCRSPFPLLEKCWEIESVFTILHYFPKLGKMRQVLNIPRISQVAMATRPCFHGNKAKFWSTQNFSSFSQLGKITEYGKYTFNFPTFSHHGKRAPACCVIVVETQSTSLNASVEVAVQNLLSNSKGSQVLWGDDCVWETG